MYVLVVMKLQLRATANSARLPACMTWTFHAQTTLTKLIYTKVRNPIDIREQY